MNNADFFHSIKTHVQSCGDNALRIRCPKAAHNDVADLVVSGKAASAELAQSLATHDYIESATFIEQAKAINLRLADQPLFDAISMWKDEHFAACCSLSQPCGQASWQNPVYAVQYAQYRASALAADEVQWDYDLADARALAVALVMFAQEMEQCKNPQSFMNLLVDLAQSCAKWHEGLLHHRAAKIRMTLLVQTNGQLTQKEAIQYPISSALLARAAAMALQNGLDLLKIHPNKDWVA
jgi:hypothetical protein